MFPETCGKTLEEVDALFAPGSPRAWRSRMTGSRMDERIRQLETKATGSATSDSANGGGGDGAKDSEDSRDVVTVEKS